MKKIKKVMNQKRIFLILLISLFIFNSCKEKNIVSTQEAVAPRRIIILYTNDEHGWMEPSEKHGGAAGLMGLWREKEGYREDGPYLIVSGGDMWTGPAISTLTQGEAMTLVMNAMDYSAAAIGNHEFDFKVEKLKERLMQSTFPFISANIREKATGKIPDFATPYLIKEINGIKLGLIGLTTTSTPFSTFPDNVKDFDFIPYTEALSEFVPRVKADGAELLIVLAHIGYEQMLELVPTATEFGIPLICGGHLHEVVAETKNGVAMIEAGSNLRYYAKADIMFDTYADTVVSVTIDTLKNQGETPDPEIAAIVTQWQNRANETLSQVIGYTGQEIEQRSTAMYNMVTDSWLFAYPADISLTNTGGIRQSITAGNITLGTIIGVLPFENQIIELELTGNQLFDSIDHLVMGGMTMVDGYKLSGGTYIHPDSSYRILITDYLYARTDNNFRRYDPEPYNTSISYRQPVIDWIKSLNTSADNPLDQYLDHKSRR